MRSCLLIGNVERFKASAVAVLMGALVACGGGGGKPPSGQNCGGTQTDTQTDVLNCGDCGHSCPILPHAVATCAAGVCGQGACEAGWLDSDPAVAGCEATQNQLPETGIVFDTFATASSFGDREQSSEAHINIAVMGEPTPPPAENQVVTTSSAHVNVGGFDAIQY